MYSATARRALAIMVAGVVLGCSGAGDVAVPTCVPGRVQACPCEDGSGSQTCQSDGTYGPCDCSPIAPVDSSIGDPDSEFDTSSPDTMVADAIPDLATAIDSTTDARLDTTAPVDSRVDTTTPVDSAADSEKPDTAVADTRDSSIIEASVDTGTMADTATIDATDAGGGTIVSVTDPCGTNALGGALIDLGAGSPVAATSTRMLSVATESWMLWDVATAKAVVRGLGVSSDGASKPRVAALRSNTFIVESVAGTIEVRDATTGVVRATVVGGARTYGLASDGSYFWGASASSIAAWSTTGGTKLFERPGDYLTAAIFGAPGELRVAKGPAGTSTIERITTAGVSSTSPISSGAFHSWFVDGERFFASVGTTVWVYSKIGGSPVGTFTLPAVDHLGGVGNRFWTYQPSATSNQAKVYDVMSGSTPLASFSVGTSAKVNVSGNRVGLISSDGATLNVLEPEATPKLTTYPAPSTRNESFAASTGGSLFVGSSYQLVHEVTSPTAAVRFGCGALSSIAAADDGTIALATAHGILLGTASGITRYMPFFARRVALAGTGATLAAQVHNKDVYHADESLHLFSLPAGVKFNQRTYPIGLEFLVDFGFSRGGTRIALRTRDTGSIKRWTTDLLDTVTDYSDSVSDLTVAPPLLLSPDGTTVARPHNTSFDPAFATTNIYKAGSLTGTASGTARAWLSDTRLLVTEFTFPVFEMKVRDATGALVATTTIPNGTEVIAVSATQVYVDNAIYDVATSAKTWSGSVPKTFVKHVAIAAKSVVTVDERGFRVVAETY
jgi:hypothetical protein